MVASGVRKELAASGKKAYRAVAKKVNKIPVGIRKEIISRVNHHLPAVSDKVANVAGAAGGIAATNTIGPAGTFPGMLAGRAVGKAVMGKVEKFTKAQERKVDRHIARKSKPDVAELKKEDYEAFLMNRPEDFSKSAKYVRHRDY